MTAPAKVKTSYLVHLPYTGITQSVVDYFDDGSVKVWWSEHPTAWAYICAFKKERGLDLVELSQEDLERLEAEHEEALKTVKEVDEERFNYMLEVLPPHRWDSEAGINSFAVPERLRGNLVAWFAKKEIGGVMRYFEIVDDARISKQVIADKINTFIQQ